LIGELAVRASRIADTPPYHADAWINFPHIPHGTAILAPSIAVPL
jgi:hypothetical protein